MSHIKEIVSIQKFTRDKVKQLLGWDDLQYGEYQMQQADAYLEYQIGADVWGVQAIRETPQFWGWWRNQWHKRDMQFVEDAKGLAVNERVLYYEITHDAEAIDFTPQGNVLQHTFATDVINPLAGRPKVERKVRL